MEQVINALTQGIDLSNKIKLPTVEVATDKQTNNVLLGTAAIVAFGLIAAAVINSRGKSARR